MIDPLRRPERSEQSKPITSMSQQSNSSKQKKIIPSPKRKSSDGEGNRSSGGGGRPNGGSGDEPSPWLITPDINPHPTASFVEYLRWMRSLPSDPGDKDRRKTQDANTKVQILQMAEDKANYRDRLTTLTDRTKLIAGEGNTFQVKCLWRIRVGGHRGPESILLPAFDALGMPYIPASTLRGVARTQAIREHLPQDLDYTDQQALKKAWKDADRQVAKWFGHLDGEGSDRIGKVIFLDAYPLPDQSNDRGGLSVDIATAIWKWENDIPKYSDPNPNPFLSLEKIRFLVGIRLRNKSDSVILDQIKKWLFLGLEKGIGSQVNTGYGNLVRAGQKALEDEFLSLDFTLEGQLIHGRQKFKNVYSPFQRDGDGRLRTDNRGKLKPDSSAYAEVRPVAFKSMLRYWFRAFALGVLPSKEVQRLEGQLFGTINPKQMRGWVTVRIADGRVVQREARPNTQGKNDPCGEQSGRLILACSSEAPPSQTKDLEALFKTLTWMMFHLGGLGQGARRPCYSRQNRDRAPWWRGATLIPDSNDAFWTLPEEVVRFQPLFQQRLQGFYEALGRIADPPVNPRQLLEVGRVSQDRWTEAVDANCRIVVCTGDEDFGKPYALATLHSRDLKVQNRRGQIDYDGNLCGQVQGGVKPSPVWISDLGDYQVVTVFGATQDPRRRYLNALRQGTSRGEFAQIFPFT